MLGLDRCLVYPGKNTFKLDIKGLPKVSGLDRFLDFLGFVLERFHCSILYCIIYLIQIHPMFFLVYSVSTSNDEVVAHDVVIKINSVKF